jgi:ABC-type lipoprotein export system ATPase subunit
LLFANDEELELSRDDISPLIPENLARLPHYVHLKRFLGDELTGVLVQRYLDAESPQDFSATPEYKQANTKFPGPSSHFQQLFKSFSRELSRADISSSALLDKKKKIDELIPFDVFYLPTYRRVEEDLQRLGYEGEFTDSQEQLIHFGMRDVSRRFKKITSDIIESAVTWYSKISGRMLDELMTGMTANLVKLEKITNPDTLGIVLDRLGQNISSQRKADILTLVQSEDIHKDKYNVLAYFLSNLIEIYDQQRDKDNRIKEFVGVTNKYLVGKEIRYDESNVTITVVNTRSETEVLLEKLSSGEKQLISILSKLYLESSRQNLIIFDEPELSLSIEWQKTLLPDILASGQCKLLLAATHSPYIFDNELDCFAEALNMRYRENSHG